MVRDPTVNDGPDPSPTLPLPACSQLNATARCCGACSDFADDRTATYFGGILAATPDTCVRFDVSDGRSTTTIAQRLDGRRCST
jgi:hypothetical protein